jgi:hypothetical protein
MIMCFGRIFITEKEIKKHRAAARSGRWIQPINDNKDAKNDSDTLISERYL